MCERICVEQQQNKTIYRCFSELWTIERVVTDNCKFIDLSLEFAANLHSIQFV